MKNKSFIFKTLSFLALFFMFALVHSNGYADAACNEASGIVYGATVSSSSENWQSNLSVSLSLAPGYTDTQTWACWLSGASANWANYGASVGEIKVCDVGGGNYDVYLIPGPASNGVATYAGARNFGADKDTCNSYVNGKCQDLQSWKGRVTGGGSSSDDTQDTDDDTPPPPPPPDTTTETTTTTDTYYLRVYYKRYGTENLLNCISSPEVQGSYEVVTTTTTTTTTTYNSDGTVASTETSTETTKSTPATAYATYSTFVCGNEYRYKTSSGLGPFTMDHDVDVSLYYEQAHKLTVNPRRIVGYSTMCNAGPWTNVYFDTDDRYQYGVGAWNSISCSTGTYDFYEYRDHNNAISSGQNAYANDTHYDSSATAIYRRRNTLTLKHVDSYNRNGDLIAGDQSATVHDYENATINPVSNGFFYGP